MFLPTALLLLKLVERETGFKPATSSLARMRSSQLSYSRILNIFNNSIINLLVL